MSEEKRKASYRWKYGSTMPVSEAFRELSLYSVDSRAAAEFWVKAHQSIGTHEFKLHDGSVLVIEVTVHVR